MMRKLIFTLSLSFLAITTSWSQTQIQASDCGTTLAAMNTNIHADAVSGADRYEFQWVDGGNTYTIDRNTNSIRPTLIPGTNYGVTYQVSVRSRDAVTQVYSAFGAACAITTPSPAGFLSTIDAASFICGSTLTSFSQDIFATPVVGASRYTFRFTEIGNPGNQVSVSRTTPWVRGVFTPGLQYNTSYDLDVSWEGPNGIMSPYGASCVVNTPITSVVSPTSCGGTYDMVTNMFTSSVHGATHYVFRFVDQTPNIADTVYVQRPNPWIRGNLAPGINYNTTYKLSVAWLSNTGILSDFDNTSNCNVTFMANTSTTEITSADCAIGTLTSMNQNIHCTPISNAVSYRFTFTEISTGLVFDRTRNSSSIRGTLVAGLSYDEAYQITVEWKQSNGIWTGPGSICTINTPSSMGMTTSLQSPYCSGSFMMSSTLKADPIPSASAYEFTFTNTTTMNVYTRIRYANSVRGSQVIGLVPGNYDVTVKWKQANGTWSAVGSTCSIVISAPNPIIANNNGSSTKSGTIGNTMLYANEFSVNVYPNPTIGYATLQSSRTIDNVEIYAMDGKMIYSNQPMQATVNLDLSSYEKGLYIVRSYSNGEYKMTKLIKK